MMSDIKETVDAIRENSFVAALEKRLTVDANDELVNIYNQVAKPSYLDNEPNRAWQSDFFTTTRFTASCFYNFFQADDTASTLEVDNGVIKPKPLTLAFASFNEFTDDVKAMFLKPAIWTFSGLHHAARFTFKFFEVIAHLVVATLDWINLKVKKNQHGSNIFDRSGAKAIEKAEETLSQDLKHAGEAALDLAESGIKMLVYPLIAGYELPAQLLSMIARSMCSYRGVSNDDVLDVVHDGVDHVKDAAVSLNS